MNSLIKDSPYIYSAVRTPIGMFNGAFSSLSATELVSFAIREAIKKSDVAMDRISDVILGNVLSAALGQAPARQAAVKAGLPTRVGAMTVNRVCGSGLQAVILAGDLVRLGESGFVVAGGMESMSRAPMVFPRSHKEESPGKEDFIDSMVHDGLWDSFSDCHMGNIAEALARVDQYSREAQDQYAMESYRRAREALENCALSGEIVPVPVSSGGKEILVERDEQPFAHDIGKISQLPPAFMKEGGTVTAGNASSLNDGAAALVVGPYDPALQPMAHITGHASHSMEPDQFPIAPVGAIQKLLERWGVGLEEIDLFEINEAFSVSTLAVCDRLNLDRRKVNIHGGAVALGHPIGASGARILVTLLHALRAEKLKFGVAAICIGGGEALALGVEMYQQ